MSEYTVNDGLTKFFKEQIKSVMGKRSIGYFKIGYETLGNDSSKVVNMLGRTKEFCRHRQEVLT